MTAPASRSATVTDAATDLRTIIRHWADLRDMLDTPPVASWPPSGLAAYLAALDEHDRAQLQAEAAREHAERNTDALGEHPAPLRLAVLDTIRTVETALVTLADQIASSVQRPPISSPPAGRGWTDELHRQVSLLAVRDQADPRRWRWHGERSAVYAARWLTGRVEGTPGPFRPLTPTQHRHIAQVAAEAARRVQTALGMDRRSRHLPRPCPRCGATLTLHTGGDRDPEVTCAGGCRPWTGPELASLLAQLEPAA